MSKGSSQPTSTTSTVTQENSAPAYLQPFISDTLSQAQNIGNTPFQAYSGSLVAPTTAATQQAYDQAPGLGSVGQNQFNQAGTALNSGLGTAAQIASGSNAAPNVQSGSWTNPGVAQSYMSPYIQNSLEAQLNIGNQQFAQQAQQRDQQAVQAGAFGGDRAGLVNEAAQRDYNNTVQNTIASGLNSAYTTGMQGYQADNSANLLAQEANQQSYNTNTTNELNAGSLQNTLGNSLSALGTAQQNAAGVGLNALYAAGQSQQAQQQNLDTTNYNQFENQVQYPENQLAWLSSLENGTTSDAVNKSTSTGITTNPITQLVGGGLSLAGLASNLNSSGG